MLSPEFDAVNFKLGNEYLAPLGFQYKNQNWHYFSDEWQLSYIIGKDKNASHFQVKFLTLAIRHSDVAMGDKKVKLVPFSDIDQGCPIRISPAKLKGYIESDFDDAIWHYVNSKRRHENEYQPIYFGGLEAFPSKIIEELGAEFTSEEVAIEKLRAALKNVAKYAMLWASHMKLEEIVRQISEHGDGWWIENQWVEAYQETLLSEL